MLKSKIKITSLILSLVVASSIFAGCGSGKTSTANSGKDEAITLKIFDKNTGDVFTDDVANEITKKTGVKVEVEQPTGNPAEKLNLMLASGDYPDIILMDRTGDATNKYISTGALIPLNDLIDKYGPDVKKMYGDTLTKIKNTDGKNYYLSNWYGKDTDPCLGFIMRQDLLKELAGDKATNGQPFTADEFKKILKDFKAKYPTINGKDSIPLTLNGENQGSAISTFKGMYGLKSYYQVNNELKYDFRDPKYLDMLKYINSLYRENLIDNEWVVNKQQLWEQKLSNGYTFATVGAYWDVVNANKVLKDSSGNNSTMYAYKVVAPGVDPSKTTYNGRNSLGWDAIGITKNCKNPEKAMQFINFLASEEGQYLLMWGLEGKSWNMVDGKHKPTDEILKEFKDDFDGTSKKTGIRHWRWFIKNGAGSDGTPYDMSTKYQKDETQVMANKNLGDTYWDTTEFDGLQPQSGTPEALTAQKITDIFNQTFPKIIAASSEAEVVELYNKMISDMEASGLADVEKVINENYKKRMELWNK